MLSPLSEKIVVHLVDNKVNSLVIDADLYDIKRHTILLVWNSCYAFDFEKFWKEILSLKRSLRWILIIDRKRVQYGDWSQDAYKWKLRYNIMKLRFEQFN